MVDDGPASGGGCHARTARMVFDAVRGVRGRLVPGTVAVAPTRRTRAEPDGNQWRFLCLWGSLPHTPELGITLREKRAYGLDAHRH